MGYIVVLFIIGMVGYGVIKEKLDTWARQREREEMLRNSPNAGKPQVDAAANKERERIRLEYQRRAEELRRKRAGITGQQTPPMPPPPVRTQPPPARPISRSVNSPSTRSPSAMNAPTPSSAYRTRSHADDVRQQQDAQRREREARDARQAMERERQRSRELDMDVERARHVGTIAKNTLAQRAIAQRAAVVAKARSAAARAAGSPPTSGPPAKTPVAATVQPVSPMLNKFQSESHGPSPAPSPPARIPGALLGVPLRQAMIIKEILDPPVSMRADHLSAGM